MNTDFFARNLNCERHNLDLTYNCISIHIRFRSYKGVHLWSTRISRLIIENSMSVLSNARTQGNRSTNSRKSKNNTLSQYICMHLRRFSGILYKEKTNALWGRYQISPDLVVSVKCCFDAQIFCSLLNLSHPSVKICISK